MKIVKLMAENFKKLIAIEIIPEDNLITITGKNGAGKSSVLDSIESTLCGGRIIPEVPLKKGTKAGTTKVDLGDYLVTRSYSAKGSYLKVETKDGKTVSSPQKLLDEIVGKISFDPLAFLNNDKVKQRNILLKLLGIDVDELNAEEKRLRGAREVIGRDLDKQEKYYDGLIEYPEVKETVLATSQVLVQTLQDAIKFNNDLDKFQADNEQFRKNAIADSGHLQDMKDARDKLNREIDALQLDLNDRREVYIRTQSTLDGTEKKPVDVLQSDIGNMEEKNNKIRANQNKVEVREQVKKLQTDYHAAAQAIINIIKKRDDLIQGSPMPVPGLSFDESGLLYNGIPLEQASRGEKIMVSLGISMALNPTLRVLRIQDGSLIDNENLEIIKRTIKENDYQLWLEVVDDSGKVGIYIEDGSIVKKGGE